MQMHMVWHQTQTHLANLSRANGTYQLMLKCNSPDIMLIALLAQFFHAQYTQHITHSDSQTMQSSPAYDKILQVANRDSCTFTYYYRIPGSERRKQSYQGMWLLCWRLYWTACISMSLLFKTTTFQKFTKKAEESVLLQYDYAWPHHINRNSYWLNLLQEVDTKLQCNLIKL
jgi:hypothetical protein